MRSRTESEAVAKLLADGVSARETSRIAGVPLRTVRSWRGRADDVSRAERRPSCGHPAHDFAALHAGDYGYLVGAYLGDGHITSHARGVRRLTIFCAPAHPAIASRVAAAVGGVIGRRVAMRPDTVQNVLYVQSYSKAWPCVLPQHGPGLEHTRRIALAAWQQTIVHAYPDELARGLIHSDGSRQIDRVRVSGRDYAYPRCELKNRSDGIRRIFGAACDALGVRWRPMGADAISVARRESVAKLDAFIGPKC